MVFLANELEDLAVELFLFYVKCCVVLVEGEVLMFEVADVRIQAIKDRRKIIFISG
jgi:hypothetical protein